MENVTRKNKVQNKVVNEFKASENFYSSDLILSNYLQSKLSKEAHNYMHKKLQTTGKRAAQEMDELSLDADKFGPQLVKRNFFGENIDEVKFHPAYQRLLEIAVESEMFTVKWKPELQEQFRNELHTLGFSAGYLYGMSESGQFCPLCMTDGVARLIDIYAEAEDKARLLPKIYTDDAKELHTGAMFLTEKSGGSDVGRNLVKAEKMEGNLYRLSGEKWFCSNVNAEIIFALARTNEEVEGTRGLSIFMIEKYLPDGTRNRLPIVRLKDKLGVRSMASAECVLDGTVGKLVGAEFHGFKIMTDMINLSRLYNSVAALACSRRALIEAYTFNLYRESFGKKAIQHTLIKDKLFELGSLHVANFYITWRAIEALDNADNGNEREAQLLRLLTPMTKKWSAEKGVYIIRESMELMGGIGYIEDGVLPKLMRDAMVLPIWEGAGNIMTLDMLRASFKSDGLTVMLEDVKAAVGIDAEYDDLILNHVAKIHNEAKKLFNAEKEVLELSAKYLFEELTTLYQLSLVLKATNDANKLWTKPTAKYLKLLLNKENNQEVFSVEEIAGLIAWEIK
jgi:acyl-CoA dehydrogenase